MDLNILNKYDKKSMLLLAIVIIEIIWIAAIISTNPGEDSRDVHGASFFIQGEITCPDETIISGVSIRGADGRSYVIAGNEPSYLTDNRNRGVIEAENTTVELLFTKIILDTDPNNFTAVGFYLESQNPLCGIFHSGTITISGNCYEAGSPGVEIRVGDQEFYMSNIYYSEISCDTLG